MSSTNRASRSASSFPGSRFRTTSASAKRRLLSVRGRSRARLPQPAICAYESSVSNAGTTLVFNPVDDAPNESATRGFGIYVESAAAGPYWVQAPGP